ncbi:hypothetical protein PS15p_200116 [Mucor circinelloides]
MGNSELHVESVDSYLVDNTNFTRVIRKMTANRFKGDGHHISPNHRANLTIKFFTEYETGEYGTTMYISLKWKNDIHLHMLGLNQTILILDPAPSLFDSQTASLYITMVAGLIVLFYFFKVVVNPTTTKKPYKQPKSRSKTRNKH